MNVQNTFQRNRQRKHFLNRNTNNLKETRRNYKGTPVVLEEFQTVVLGSRITVLSLRPAVAKERVVVSIFLKQICRNYS